MESFGMAPGWLTARLLCALTAIFALTPLSAAANAQAKWPPLASVSAIASEIDSGRVLLAKHSQAVLSIASVTKVMTAIVAIDSGKPLEEWLHIVGWDKKPEKNTYSRLRINSEARRKDLLRIALMSSENLAAYNLARHHPAGLEAFVAAMNEKAAALGMINTRFVDPMGLSPDNQSTAEDLARMVKAAYAYELIRSYSTTRQHTVQFRAPRYHLSYGNTNPLTGSSKWNVSLTKTGYLTEAGRCLVMVVEAEGEAVTMVLLNSFGKRTPLGDAGRIRRWLESGTVSSVAGAALDYEQRMLKTHGLDKPLQSMND